MRRILLIGAAIASLALSGCSGSNAAEQGGAAPQAARALPVAAYEARSQDANITLEYPARIVSSGFVEVRAKVGGTLLSRDYGEGSVVLKDALLFTIDPAKYQAAKDAAEASFNQAKREYERAKKLFAQKAISERDRDAALAAYETTRAALQNAMIDLDYTKVKAPIDGFVGMKAIDSGNLVSAGTLLTTITKTNPVYAEFAFSDFEKLKRDYEVAGASWSEPGAIKVGIKSESGEEYPNRGKIDFIDAAIDTSTGSVKARAVLPNSMGYLTPGQFGRVVLSGLVKRNAVEVPATAVMQGQLGSFVYVIRNGKAAAQPIKIANEGANFFTISEGLKDGDLIIINNLTKLRPDMPVVRMTAPQAK